VGILEELKRCVQIIDIFYLERLLLGSFKTRDLIRGKDIILIVGNTGCGKSATILKFLGNQFKAIEESGSIVFVPEDLKD
jgi:ABC-type phosphate transport system ATPase subunit